jgi:hypothetical protein
MNLFDFQEPNPNHFRQKLTAVENGKGILDVDTVKGCSRGMHSYPVGGCYGECYAFKTARRFGFDFSVSISRKLFRSNMGKVFFTVKNHSAAWYRVGTTGDPCHDWGNTIHVCEQLSRTQKTPVIVTKHWIPISEDGLQRLRRLGTVINTSTSGMDSEQEIQHRTNQHLRLKDFGIKAILRVVTCLFGLSEWARACHEKQAYLLSLVPVIDTPLRIRKSNARVINGDILADKVEDSIGGGGRYISINSSNAYLGACKNCPDQCGTK